MSQNDLWSVAEYCPESLDIKHSYHHSWGVVKAQGSVRNRVADVL